jgi:ABC-type antimicrobial peptide transport system permease subunit
MRQKTRMAVLAATTGFILGLFEFGFVFEGLVLSLEDMFHLDTTTRIVGVILVGIASVVFAIYAARSAIRTQLQNLEPSEPMELQ